mmetsp:Transcript_4079/g.6286  ORF Transcript_4079/g.6286 Transcript_4079/m.6286 type:complete len:204 (-) Transcript_4079:108-719(-)
MMEARTHVMGEIVAYVRSREVFNRAKGFWSDRSHSTRISVPLSLYGTLNLTMGILAVKRSVLTSRMPAAVNLLARLVIASTPLPSFVNAAAEAGMLKQRSRSELGLPNPLALDPNTATFVPGGNSRLCDITCSIAARTCSLRLQTISETAYSFAYISFMADDRSKKKSRPFFPPFANSTTLSDFGTKPNTVCCICSLLLRHIW